MLFANRIWFLFFAIALAPATTFLASPPASAQGAKKLTPELQRARDALDKYKDPVVAVHDGYWSTVGCVWYRKPGVETVGSSPQEFAAIIKSEAVRLDKVIRSAGIRVN